MHRKGRHYRSGSTPGSTLFRAHRLYAKRMYSEAQTELIQVLRQLLKDENWLMASAALAQIGRCASALGHYQKANYAFRQARAFLQRAPHSTREDGVLQLHIEQSSCDELSKDELARLRADCVRLCDEEKFDQADALCREALAQALRHLGHDDWFVAMVKATQAYCKLNRVNAACGDCEDAEGLLEHCRRNLADVQRIAGLVQERAFWINRMADELERALLNSQSVHDGFTDFGDDGVFDAEDSERFGEMLGLEDGEETAQPARPQHRRRAHSLSCWGEPFVNVNFTITEQVADLMEPANQLFVRQEYQTCLKHADQVLGYAVYTGNRVLAALSMVMRGRCLRALGVHSEARESFQSAAVWLRDVPEFGTQLSATCSQIAGDCDRDSAFMERADKLRSDCTALCGKGQYEDAFDLCGFHMRAIGAEHWFAAVCMTLQANCLVARGQALLRGEAVTTIGLKEGDAPREQPPVDLLGADAKALLSAAERLVNQHGHNVFWVKDRTFSQVRANLEALLDALEATTAAQ